MPILQNKLVMKSIEALHDEALALRPDSASENGVGPCHLRHISRNQVASRIVGNAPATDGDDIWPD
ncbi:MAG: hypothetical protein CM15mP46_0400 [Alphaproteobacteria bacterium]|nr:MAG: hypothetical protein CM15mP46_0400 [Alphaproteobacteria bacterium]